jgi:hypothetical protein
MFRFFVVVLLLVFTFIPVTYALDYQALGRIIRVNLPAGYCAQEGPVTAQDKREQADVDKAVDRQMTVILRFEDCHEQRELREGVRSAISKYGLFSIVKQRGEIVPAPAQYSRSEYLSQIGKIMQRSDILQRVQKITDEEIAKWNRPKSLIPKALGSIGQDSNALYVAVIVTSQDAKGRQYQTSGVVGMTLVRGLPVNSSIYAEYSETSFAELLKRQQVILNAIVNDNP